MNLWRVFWLLALILMSFLQLPSDALTMPFPPANFSQVTAIPLALYAPRTLFAGDTLLLEIQIGNADSIINDLFGLSFRLNYPSNKWMLGIPNADGKILARGGFWPENAFIFSRQDTLLNQFQVAITQLAGMPGLTGTGQIAWLRFKIDPQTPDSTLLNFGLSNIVAINSRKDTLRLHSDEIQVTVYQHPVFNLRCQPRNLSINWGETARYQVLLDTVRYLREAVKLSCQVDTELSAEFIPPQIGKSDTAELLIRTKPEIFREENYKIPVQGQIPHFFQTDTVRLQVTSPPFFKIRVRPDTFTIFPGDSVSAPVFLDSVWKCSQGIQLACHHLSAEIGTGNFSREEIFTNDSSLLKIQTDENAPPGEYLLTIIGEGNNFIDSTNLVLKIIQRPDFSLVVIPDFQSIFAGQQAKFIIKLDSVVNFKGQVHLKIQNFPSEAGTAVIQPDSIASGDSAAITIATTPATAPGIFPLFIVGTASGMTKTAAFSLDILPVPDFMLQVNPLAQTIAAGESTFFQIRIESLHHFQDSVALSYAMPGTKPPDVQIAFETPKIVPGHQTSLSIISTLQTKPADYQIIIQAKTATLSHEQAVTLVINAPPLAAEWILPNPFTPNQDGFNDQVQFNLHQIETDGTVIIFNFRGQKVRELRNMSNWDGTDDSGAALPMGIYFYLVKIQNELKARGSLTLVR